MLRYPVPLIVAILHVIAFIIIVTITFTIAINFTIHNAIYQLNNMESWLCGRSQRARNEAGPTRERNAANGT